MSGHGFVEQLERGAVVEALIARWLTEAGRTVRPATPEEQERGIDLVVDGSITLEVKADYRAHETGNVAIETVATEACGEPGWLWSCTADWLLYCAVGTGEALWVRPEALRARALRTWRYQARVGSLRTARTQNRAGYTTVFWLVPLQDLRLLVAESVVQLPDLRALA